MDTNNTTTTISNSCYRLFLPVAAKLLDMAEMFLKQHHEEIVMMILHSKKNTRSLHFDKDVGLFISKGNKSKVDENKENGFIISIEDTCLVKLLLGYRVLVKEEVKAIGVQRLITDYMDIEQKFLCGFPIVSQNLGDKDGFFRKKNGSPSYHFIQNDTASIHYVARALAKKIPYADIVFSAILYLWNHLNLLQTFIKDNIGEFNQVIIGCHNNYLNDERAKSFNCVKCGGRCEILAYTNVVSETIILDNKKKIVDVRIFQCIHCGELPEKSKLICATKDGLYSIKWWRDVINKLQEVDVIGSGEKEEAYCLGLLDEREDGQEFFLESEESASLPPIRMGGIKGVRNELIQMYAVPEKALKGNKYDLFNIPKANDRDPNEDNYQTVILPERQVYTTAQFLRRQIIPNFGSLEPLPYTAGSASREGVVIQYWKTSKRSPGGYSKFHCDPAKALNLALSLFNDKLNIIDTPCEAFWFILHPKSIDNALEWREKKIGNRIVKGIKDGIMFSYDMMKACAKHLNDKEGATVAWVVKQHHGDIIHIPIGYAHTVTNGSPCYKVAMDFLPTGNFYQCMIAHLFVHRKLGNKHTDDYLAINTHVMEEVRIGFGTQKGPKLIKLTAEKIKE